MGAAPVDELVELRTRDDALVGGPPRFVVGGRDGVCVRRLGAPDLDQGRAHARIQASAPAAIKPYV